MEKVDMAQKQHHDFADKQEERSPENSEKAIVLVVDDEKNMIRTIRLSLDGVDGYKIESASSGNQAIKLIAEGLNPDVILTDIAMPDGTGLRLRNWIEENKPEFADRIILMTANVDDEELKDVIQEMAGKNRFLEKPFEIDQLRDAIKGVLLGNSASK